MVRLASGALDTIGLSQLTNGLITLHIIDKMLDVDLHSRTPVRGSRHGDPEEQAAFVIDLNLLLQDWPMSGNCSLSIKPPCGVI
jgi:hypothetical protein